MGDFKWRVQWKTHWLNNYCSFRLVFHMCNASVLFRHSRPAPHLFFCFWSEWTEVESRATLNLLDSLWSDLSNMITHFIINSVIMTDAIFNKKWHSTLLLLLFYYLVWIWDHLLQIILVSNLYINNFTFPTKKKKINQ